MPSPYATQEDSKLLWIEQSTYISTHLAAIAYGFLATIFASVLYFMFHPEPSQRRRRRLGWLIIAIALFIIGTINLVCGIGFNESAWVTERNYPGGPAAFLEEQQSRPITGVGGVTTVLGSILVDGILLYRTFIVWNRKWYVVVPLAIIYVVTTVLAILRVVELHLVNNGGMPDLGLPTWTMLMATNIILSGTIAIRILMMRHSVKEFLGPDHAAVYTGTAAVVIEAAIPFLVVSIVLLALFGGNNTSQDLFIPLLVQLACISPLLIILRIFRNQAWSNDPAHAPYDQRSGASRIHTEKPMAFASTTSNLDVEIQLP